MILPLLALCLCWLHAYGGWIGPFLGQTGHEYRWDAASHFAQMLATLGQGPLWPTGPNWDFYCGEPTGQFYPVGFHLLASWTTAFVPPAQALKTVGALSFALIPLALYVLVLQLGLRGARAACALLGSWSFLTLSRTTWLPQENVGGTLQATFETGLFPAALGLALVLLYVARLLHELAGQGRLPLAGVLLGLIALTHVAAASFAAVITLAGYLVAFAEPGEHTRRGLLVRALLHAATSLLIAAPYALPFLVDREEARVLHLPMRWGAPLLSVLFVACLAIGAHFARGKWTDPRTRFALLVATALAGLVLADVFAVEFHLYRYPIFLLVLTPILLLTLEPSRKVLALLFALFSLQLLHGEAHSPPLEPPPSTPLALPERQGSERITAGATLAVALPHEQGGIHVLQHRIPLETEFRGLLSVIVEANPLAPFAHHVAKELEPGLPQWGLRYDPLKRYEVVHRQMLHAGPAAERRIANALDDIGALIALPRLQKAFHAASQPGFANARDTFRAQLERLSITSVVTTRQAEALFTSMGWRRAPEPVFVHERAIPPHVIARLSRTHRLEPSSMGSRFAFDLWMAPRGVDPPLVEIVRPPRGPRGFTPVREGENEIGFLEADFVETLDDLQDVSSARFFEREGVERLVVQGAPFPISTAEDARIQDLEVSPDGREIRFRVTGPIAVPAIVKAQWSRRWRAYEDDVRIPVRRVAPNFLLLHTLGEVTLRYEEGWPEILGRIAFPLGLLLFLVQSLWIWRRRSLAPSRGGTP